MTWNKHLFTKQLTVTLEPSKNGHLKRIILWASVSVGAVSLLILLSVISLMRNSATAVKSEDNLRPSETEIAEVTSSAVPGIKGNELRQVRSLKSRSPVWAVTTHRQVANQSIVVGGNERGNIDIWNQQTGELIRTLSGHHNAVRSLAISASGQRLVSSSADDVKVWDLEQGTLLYRLPAEASTVWSVAISPDEQTLVSGRDDGIIEVRQLESCQMLYRRNGGQRVWSVAFMPDGKSFFSGGSDRAASGSEKYAIRQWDLTTGEVIQTFSGQAQEGQAQEGHNEDVRSVAVSADGRTLVSGSGDSTIKLWDVASGQLKATLNGHEGAVVSVATSPDGKTIASSSNDNTIRLWDVDKQQLTATLNNGSNGVSSVAFGHSPNLNPDDSLLTGNISLIGIGRNQRVKIWN